MAATDATAKPRLPILVFCAGHMAVDWPHGAFWILAPAIALSMDLAPSDFGLMISLINYLFRIHLIVGDLRLNWVAPAILTASLAAYFLNRRWAMIVILLLWYVSLANSARVNFWIT